MNRIIERKGDFLDIDDKGILLEVAAAAFCTN